ncbi:MAG: GxxExxY protein [Endomicrobia bacterium]|nr:GxxExxY protein [Endomicrobiia bacterium]MDW8056131.1 GxxExxY protein [Elusimicrobiota bacterium]
MNQYKDIVKQVADEVMSYLGGYYNEAVYEEAFVHELRLRGIPYERQRNVEIIYKGFSVGICRPDCILYPLWSGSKEEFLVEMKSLAKIDKPQIRQAEIYLASMNIANGVVLNFNKKTNTAEVVEVLKPTRQVKREIHPQQLTTNKKITEKILEGIVKEVLDYLGSEFFYYSKEGVEIYIRCVAVELRLNNLEFHSLTYPVLYKSQQVAEYTYDFVFSTGEVAKIFAYKKQEEFQQQLDEFKFYNKLFNIKSGYIVAIPFESELNPIIREILI